MRKGETFSWSCANPTAAHRLERKAVRAVWCDFTPELCSCFLAPLPCSSSELTWAGCGGERSWKVSFRESKCSLSRPAVRWQLENGGYHWVRAGGLEVTEKGTSDTHFPEAGCSDSGQLWKDCFTSPDWLLIRGGVLISDFKQQHFTLLQHLQEQWTLRVFRNFRWKGSQLPLGSKRQADRLQPLVQEKLT